MANARMIPGGGVVVEQASQSRMLPGIGVIIETITVSAPPPAAGTTVRYGVSLYSGVGRRSVRDLNRSIGSAGVEEFWEE